MEKETIKKVVKKDTVKKVIEPKNKDKVEVVFTEDSNHANLKKYLPLALARKLEAKNKVRILKKKGK